MPGCARRRFGEFWCRAGCARRGIGGAVAGRVVQPLCACRVVRASRPHSHSQRATFQSGDRTCTRTGGHSPPYANGLLAVLPAPRPAKLTI